MAKVIPERLLLINSRNSVRIRDSDDPPHSVTVFQSPKNTLITDRPDASTLTKAARNVPPSMAVGRLGSYIVKNFVKLLDGRIEAHSELGTGVDVCRRRAPT